MIKIKARDGRDPRELAAMNMGVHLKDKALKGKYVATMFDILAPGYDQFTRVFSFGRDLAWKTLLIEKGADLSVNNPQILDLACGTGDLATQFARRTHATGALAFDFSPQMLAEAQRRSLLDGTTLRLVACDMLHLCLPDNLVDVVSIGYGIRNTADAKQALREIARVVKPGGILLNLDFYRPAQPIWRELFLWYLWNAGRLAGWLWHREPTVYGYIAPSIRAFWTISEFETQVQAAGFQIEWRASRLGGGVGLHVARRKRA